MDKPFAEFFSKVFLKNLELVDAHIVGFLRLGVCTRS